MSKKVVYAKLHTGPFIPGVGTLTDTLPPQGKTLKDFTMYKAADGNLQLSWTDLQAGTNETAEVGASNVIVLKYESEKRGNVA